MRDQALLKNMVYRENMARYHNKRVKMKDIIVGSLLLLKDGIGTKSKGRGKLAPNWEGPYIVDSEH